MENTTQGRKLTIEQILMPLFLNAGYNCDEPNERRLFIAAADAMKKYTAQEKQEQRDPDGWVFRKNFYNNHKDAVIAAGGAGGDHLDLHPVWFSPPPVREVSDEAIAEHFNAYSSRITASSLFKDREVFAVDLPAFIAAVRAFSSGKK